MSDEKKPEVVLTVVPPEQATPEQVAQVVSEVQSLSEDLAKVDSHISRDDIERLNVEKLREGMLKSIFLLEHCLFSQAGKEYQRIADFRDMMSMLEKHIFVEEQIKNMNPMLRINLYKMVGENLRNSLAFMQTLHKDVTGGFETLTNIEKIKSQQKPATAVATGTVDRTKLEHIKKLIETKIRSKIDAKENAK